MNPESIAPTWSDGRRADPETDAATRRDAIVYAALRRLDRAGIRASVRRQGDRWRPTGTAVRAEPGRFPGARLRRDLARGLSVSVHLSSGLDPDWLGQELDRLAGALPRARDEQLEWSIEADDANADALISIVRERWPASPGYCFESPSSTTPAEAGRDGATRWFPALHAGVRSHCPLLSAERSTVLLPHNGLAVPIATGWLTMELDLMRIADAGGFVAETRIDAALDCCIADGDRLLDRLSWPSRAEAEDARLNRRLALMVTGIGDLVVARGQDPSSLGCLRGLDGLMERIHTGLSARSRRLAAATAPLPVLTERVPGAGCRDEAHRADWHERWRAAVREVQVRHRNLLALSPWSLLPRHGQVQPAFVDLAPLLAHADALGFGLQRVPAAWSMADFRYFRARVVAQVKRMNATTFIAVGA